jgi:hypothetical protein
MKYRNGQYITFFATITLVLVTPDNTLATQAHGAPEGIYAHQLAHIFFIISMGFLIHWLRERKLVRESGWRFIQYAAFFLILWNIDAFTVHLLSEQINIIQFRKVGSWQVQINAINSNKGLEVFYYIAKLDHLFCVPALFFLYSGLKRLTKESSSQAVKPDIMRNG